MPLTAALDSVNTNDLQNKIEQYEKKINSLQNREKSLAGEIDYMDTQIGLTELRIQSSVAQISETQEQIKKLETEIDDLKNRIEHLEDSISYQRDLLSNRSRERYKSGLDSPFIMLFGAQTLNDLVKKTEYLKLLELEDNKLLSEMERTKQSYSTQKNLYVDKKTEEETLKKKLETEKANLDSYKNNLEDQQNEKKRLLDITQNDEKKYQDLLADAQRELSQITGAVNVLKYQSGKEVKAGELIGYQGNTGYSFGEHLHFGVYKYSSFDDIDGWDWYYSKYVDPRTVLKKKTVYWNTGCESASNKSVGSGSWTWPLGSPTISQGFGVTCWSSRLYGGKVHPALDMYGGYGSAVYAAADGTAYFCRNCLGDGGNGVFIFHKNNYMTVYWHLR
jgi:peptidoglycan hydrolase CwlO-like protein